MLWNSLKEKSIIFLIFKSSQHYLEFLISGKGALLGPCHKRAACPVCFPPTVCGQLTTQLHPSPLPKGSLVALPTQSLFVMKSFMIVSSLGKTHVSDQSDEIHFHEVVTSIFSTFFILHITYHYL